MAGGSKVKPEPWRNPSDDSQLTIKIPNPKVYMARQSLWIGRRGKPRCDHCRLNNLKCDRVLPACNHCLWSTGRVCKYTPLPTPAHRGIPRCDWCRSENLKCDRSLPVCNHCKEDMKKECHYTPKKRRKAASQTAPLLMKRETADTEEPSLGFLHNLCQEKIISSRNIVSTSRTCEDSPSPASESPSGSSLQNLQTGRFTADLATFPYLPLIAPKPQETQPPSFPCQGLRVTIPSLIVPWTHPTLAPLPEFIIRGSKSINSAEMPNATTFNESLARFLDETLDEIRETSCLALDTYTTVSRCLSTGDASKLSPRLREWISFHHLCSGSDQFDLILMPRESTFQTDESSRESYRRVFCAQVDGSADVRGSSTSDDSGDTAGHFDRLPVREQIFDILTYAHVSHSDAFAMLFAIKSWGFASVTWPMAELYVRLCPLCGFCSNRLADSPRNP